MVQISRKTLQSAATIAKTTETVIDVEIPCGGFEELTLFFTYVNGDETGLNIYPYYLQESAGTEFQDRSWTAAPGTKISTTNILQVSASGDYYAVFDIRGIEFIKFYQGGSNNDGTPTGTLAASYAMTEN